MLKRIIPVLVLFGVLMASESVSAVPEHTELSFLIERLMPEENSPAGVLSWDTESENPNITWEERGTHNTPEGRARTGNVFIETNSERSFKLGTRKVYLPWGITMYGSNAGIHAVSMGPHPETFGATNSGGKIYFAESLKKNPKLTFELIGRKTQDTGATITEHYIVQCAGRMPVLVRYSSSCGSGGCTEEVTLLVSLDDQRKVVKNWDKTSRTPIKKAEPEDVESNAIVNADEEKKLLDILQGIRRSVIDISS